MAEAAPGAGHADQEQVGEAWARSGALGAAPVLAIDDATALRAIHGAIYEWDARTERVARSAGLLELVGIAPDQAEPTIDWWRRRVHPDDRAQLERLLPRPVPVGVTRMQAEYRVRHADGRWIWIWDRAVALRDAAGTVRAVIGHTTDISAHRNTEQELRDREQRLQLALDASHLQVWTFDPLTRRLEASAGLCAHFGLERHHCLGLGPWRRRVHPDERARVQAAFEAALGGEAPFDEVFRVRRADGSIVWLDTQAILVDGGHKGPSLFGVCADISGRKLQEQSLREGGRRLGLALAAARMSTWTINLDGYRLVASEGLKQIFGFTDPAPVAVDDWVRCIHPADREAAVRSFRESVQRGTPFETELRVRRPDGTTHWLNAQAVIDSDEGGGTGQVYGVAADITARKQAEKRLADSEAQMRLLTDALPVGILRCGADLRYRFVNPVYAEQFMQLQPQQLVGRFMSEMLDHEVYAATRPYLDQVLAGCMVEYEMPVVLPRGHRHIHVSYVPEFKGSEVEGFVGVVTDITERVEAQIERDRLHALEHQARRQAEAATKARDEFLAIVSHELRSPLNGIQSWAHVLESVLRSELPTVQRALAGIRTGVEQQVRLIDDLLDATRIMSGKLSLIKQNVNLRPVVEAALASVRASAQAKQVALIADYRADEGQLDGDPDRLQQIVWNLLSNAIKFVPSRGHVWLSAWSEGGEALIQVRDDGKGIDPAFVPHLFDWFSRDETSSHRGQDGLGLGLALVRHLCELHDGSVAAESPGPGRGATFTVRLPLRRAPRVLYSAPAPGHSDTPLPSLEGVRVMLVDDQRETRESVSTLLTQAGAEVTVFASGEEAVARLEQESERRPQVLVCDIAMPGQDGYATLARIRVRENAAGVPRAERVRAAALTAFAQREDRIRALSAGFESYITKPVSLDELIIVVAALAGRGLESAGRSWPPLW